VTGNWSTLQPVQTDFLQAIITTVAIMNPIGTAPIFQNMVSPLPFKRQRAAAVLVCVFIASILIVTAFAGRILLDLFGISIDAFRAAGGVVIGIMGYQMLRGERSDEHERLADESSIREHLLIPFAMPLVAGPGTITTIITLSVSHVGYGIPWTALTAVFTSVLVTGACLFTILAVGRYFSRDAQRIFTRFMGLILMAMGMEFLLRGIGAFFAGDL